MRNFLVALLLIQIGFSSLLTETNVCQANSYYTTTNYNCAPCGLNAIQNVTSGQSCQCIPGYKKVVVVEADRHKFQFDCETCQPGEVTTQDDLKCLPCGASGTVKAGECVCTDASFYLSDQNPDGTQRTSIECVTCPYGSYVNGEVSSWECVSCPDPGQKYDKLLLRCVCDESKGFMQAGSNSCVTKTDRDRLYDEGFLPEDRDTVYYESLVNSKGALPPNSLAGSDIFRQFFVAAAVGCKYHNDPKSCQTVANLCIMQLYNERSNACQLLKSIKSTVPDIYIIQPPRDILSTTIDLTVQFTNTDNNPSRTQFLSYFLARYNIEGAFLGFQELKTQFSICPISYRAVVNMKRFGVVTEIRCDYELSGLTGGTNEIPKDANAFFELFIKDRTGNLINVPVLISNFRDLEGNTPNTALDVDNSRLVNRFFISDTISGIDAQGGYLSGEKSPIFIRYAKQVKLRVQLDPNTQEHILTPLLYIEYEERPVNSINSDTQAQISYFVDFFEDVTQLTKDLIGIFVAANIVVIAIVIIRIYNWTKHNPTAILGAKFAQRLVLQTVFFVVDEWSTMMFWVSFFITGYWFIMYKMQDNAYLLLPSTEETFYSTFTVIFLITMSFKTAAVLFRIFEQSNADVILMDWEKPRKIATEDKEEAVVAWRSTFIANEVNEIQSQQRKIHPETTLIWFLFFWVGIGWENYTQTNPDFIILGSEHQPYNLLLKFFLSAFIMLVIVAIEYILFLLFNLADAPHIQRFTDLCSVSNISILIMQDQIHGYYINGKAPWMQSDLPISWLKAELDKERKGRSGVGRDFGIQRQMANAQRRPQDQRAIAREPVTTFEIYMTARLRRQYDDLVNEPVRMTEVIDEQLAMKPDDEKVAIVQKDAALREEMKTSKQVKKERYIRAFEEKRRRINRLLITEFEKVQSKEVDVILDHTCCQRLFKRVPDQVDIMASEGRSPFWLVKDPYASYPNFEKVLYMSLDFELVLLYILWFIFLELYTENAVLSIFLVYLIEKAFRQLRQFLGARNLIRKSMFDERFLM